MLSVVLKINSASLILGSTISSKVEPLVANLKNVLYILIFFLTLIYYTRCQSFPLGINSANGLLLPNGM